MQCNAEWIDDPKNAKIYKPTEIYFYSEAPDIEGLTSCQKPAVIKTTKAPVVAACEQHAEALKKQAKDWRWLDEG
jgi:hypothetical protein